MDLSKSAVAVVGATGYTGRFVVADLLRRGITPIAIARNAAALDPAKSVGDALARARAYAGAGASGLFIPGLQDDALIGRICAGAELPVNVMVMDGVPSNGRLAELGVARISYGPIPYISAMNALKEDALKVLS
jgi:2-methylisocitrate lyase-like PEP mutase family enzyme